MNHLQDIRREIAPAGALRAAINYNNPLLAKRHPSNGELQGLAVDLSRELARRLGLELELVPYEAASKISRAAQEGVWDLGFLALDPLRANEIEFTAPYLEIEGTYGVPVGSPVDRIDEVDRAENHVGVTAGSAYDLFLSRTLQHARLVRAEDNPKSIELLFTRDVDVVAAVRTALVAAFAKRPGYRVISGHFMTIPQAAGVPKGRLAAARYLSEFLAEIAASGFLASTLKMHGLGPDDAIIARSLLSP